MSEVEKQAIDQVIQLFFRVFSNKQVVPNFALLNQLCIPEVQIILKDKSTHTVYKLSTFIEPRKKILTDGTLTDFEEFETHELTNIKGGLAQRASRYSKSGVRNQIPFQQSGNKYFQLLKTSESWKISSVIWEDD